MAGPASNTPTRLQEQQLRGVAQFLGVQRSQLQEVPCPQAREGVRASMYSVQGQTGIHVMTVARGADSGKPAMTATSILKGDQFDPTHTVISEGNNNKFHKTMHHGDTTLSSFNGVPSREYSSGNPVQTDFRFHQATTPQDVGAALKNAPRK